MSLDASRRAFLSGSASALALPLGAASGGEPGIEPFHGPHQAGILTRRQACCAFAVFDVTAARRAEVGALLRHWTAAAARLAAGKPADDADSGENRDLPPARLTVTFGFGPGLFVKDGQDRFGLTSQRPAALIDLPAFPGDRLEPRRTGGDLAVQACAEDPQSAFHAIRQLARLASGTARLRWLQSGVLPSTAGQTPRNLLGFKDGTQTLNVADPFALSAAVWAGAEAPPWMRGGTYLVVRRIRLALESWDALPQAEQERTIGRRKDSGAPLGGTREFDPERFGQTDQHGSPTIPDNAHIRLASFEGSRTRLLRRSYAFNDGLVPPPEGAAAQETPRYDAGLLFLAYQKDPRLGFIPMFDQLSRRDRLAQFATHTGSGVFAIPPGIAPGATIGETLFA